MIAYEFNLGEYKMQAETCWTVDSYRTRLRCFQSNCWGRGQVSVSALLSEIAEAIKKTNAMIDEPGDAFGTAGMPSVADLQIILSELEIMQSQLRAAPLSSASRTSAIGRIVLENWWKLKNDEVASELVDVSGKYNELIRRAK